MGTCICLAVMFFITRIAQIEHKMGIEKRRHQTNRCHEEIVLPKSIFTLIILIPGSFTVYTIFTRRISRVFKQKCSKLSEEPSFSPIVTALLLLGYSVDVSQNKVITMRFSIGTLNINNSEQIRIHIFQSVSKFDTDR